MRVFVTVGNALDPFDRMLRMVDEAVPREGVAGICQHGSSSVVPHGLEGRQRLSRAEFERELRESDVVICHAGVGSIRAAMDAGHRPIVMARLVREGEHVNDHQLEICRELAQRGSIVWVESLGQMRAAFAARTSTVHSGAPSTPNGALDALSRALSTSARDEVAEWAARALGLLARLCPATRLRYPFAPSATSCGVDAPAHHENGLPTEPR